MVLSLTSNDIKSVANWPMVIKAMRDGHKLPKANVGDTFVGGAGNTMLVRSAWIDGLAAGVKAATVVPENPNRESPLPTIHAQVMLFSHETGQLTALLDGTEVTTWKTAGDSALGSDLLSRQDSENFLMVGAGTMAEPLIRAHLTVRPNLKKIFLWNRTRQRCEQLAGKLADLSQSVELVDDLDKAAGEADIICCATMTNEPVLRGAWVSPGCHVDLVGAYKADMREVDDDMHARASWFVDSYDTTLHHIGELKIPLEQGVITKDAIKGDFHEIIAGDCGRASDAEITVLKNGGGAHLDVMVCSALARAFGN